MHFGISAAITTPFAEDGAVCIERLAKHARHVLAQGADGLTLFGTTGEGASLGPTDRARAFKAVLEAEIDPGILTACICATATEDVARQVGVASDNGVSRLLLTPPYYFKGVDEDGLFTWFSTCLADMPAGARVILYHLPAVTEVPLSLDLVRRLKDRFPESLVAVKDSAGVWPDTLRLLEDSGVSVLVGDERQLANAMNHGGAGTICGLANLIPQRLRRIIETGEEDEELNALVNTIVSFPVLPLMKALVGEVAKDSGWQRVRAPLLPSAQGPIDTVMAQLQPMLASIEC